LFQFCNGIRFICAQKKEKEKEKEKEVFQYHRCEIGNSFLEIGHSKGMAHEIRQSEIDLAHRSSEQLWALENSSECLSRSSRYSTGRVEALFE